MPADYVETAIRLAAAAVLGCLLGLTRDMADKPAGMRTMGLVALGAALITLVAHNAFPEAHPDAQSRVLQGVIQGVLTGVGFIGAGAVLHNHEQGRVRGLTTAAIVWVAAAAGVACGLGEWGPVSIGAVVALLLIVVLHPFERRIERRARDRRKKTGDDPSNGL